MNDNPTANLDVQRATLAIELAERWQEQAEKAERVNAALLSALVLCVSRLRHLQPGFNGKNSRVFTDNDAAIEVADAALFLARGVQS